MSPLSRIVFVIVALAAAVPARADSADAHAQAEQLTRAGVALYSRGDYAGAIAQFTRANALFPDPKLFFNIGQAELHQGHSLRAANAFELFLDRTIAGAPDIASQQQTARARLSALGKDLGELRVKAWPEDAEVRVDGVLLDDLNVFVTPGTHHVEVRANGFASTQRDVLAPAGVVQDLAIRLVALPPPTPSVAQAPSPPPVSAPLTALAPAPRPSHTASWVLFGVGGAALAVGAVFGVAASNSNSQLHDAVTGGSPMSPADISNLRSTVRTQAWVSTGALAAGVVSAAIGGLLFLHHGSAPAAAVVDSAGQPALSMRF